MNTIRSVFRTLIVMTTPVLLGVVTCSFNSQEHKIVSDAGVSRVIFPASIKFPAGMGFFTNYQAAYLSGWQGAKMMAVGFNTNNPNDYDRYRKGVQDNCYWTGFGQLEYNKNNYIEAASQFPSSPLLYISNMVGSQNQTFSFGDLVALYGDYRRTVTNNQSGCYMTDSTNNDNVFSLGNYPDYCPPTTTTYQYLKNIAFGLWPPFGTAGNVFKNTAGEYQFNEAAWWGDEMMRIANVNENHFSNGAIAWYIGMHRLALVAVNNAIRDPKYWSLAFNYETSALHALTDLFAFGHVVTNRDQSSYGTMKNDGLLTRTPNLWMENSIRMGGGTRPNPSSDNYPGKIYLSNTLPPISFMNNPNRRDYMPSYLGTWAAWAKAEHDYHDYFNKTGATVRNINGDRFQVYGDAKLHDLDAQSRRVIENAVTASAQALVDAYGLLIRNRGNIESVGRAGSSYFKALKYVPVYIESDPDNYFTGMWTLFASPVRAIAGRGALPVGWEKCRIPFLSGADWGWPAKQTKPCTPFIQ